MQQEQLYGMVTGFHLEADATKGLLNGVIQKINEGKVPESAQMDAINSRINNLRSMYDDIVQCTEKFTDGTELPETGSGVDAYREAGERYMANVIMKRVKEAQAVLESFLRIRSTIEQYTAALRPYQEAVENLLKGIMNMNEETLANEIVGPKAFIKAMQFDTKPSQEWFSLLNDLGEYYSQPAVFGIVSGAYYLEDADTVTGTAKEVKAAEEPEPVQAAVEPEPEQEQEEELAQAPEAEEAAALAEEAEAEDTPAAEAAEEEAEAETEETAAAAEEEAEEETEEEIEEAAESEIEAEAAANLEAEDDGQAGADAAEETAEAEGAPEAGSADAGIGELSPAAIEKYKLKRFHENQATLFRVADFRRDLITNGGFEHIIAMSFLGRTGFLSEALMQITLAHIADQEKRTEILQSFEKLGYTDRWTSSVMPEAVYTITQKSAQAFANSTTRTIIYRNRETGRILDRAIRSDWTVLAKIMMADACRKHLMLQRGLDDSNQQSTFNIVSTTDNSFQVLIGYNREIAGLYTGILTKNPEEERRYLESLDSDSISCEYVVVAGINDAHAKKQCDAVSPHVPAQLGLFYTSPESEYVWNFRTGAKVDHNTILKVAEAGPEPVIPARTVQDTGKQGGHSSGNAGKSQKGSSSKVTPESKERSTKSETKAQGGKDEDPDPEKSGESGEETAGSGPGSVTGEPAGDRPAAESRHKEEEAPLGEEEKEIFHAIASGEMYAGSALLHYYAQQDRKWVQMDNRFAYAVNDPMKDCSYRADDMVQIFYSDAETEDVFMEYLAAASAIRVLFSDQFRYDYSLQNMHTIVTSYAAVNAHTELKELLYLLYSFKSHCNRGMDAVAEYHESERRNISKRLEQLQAVAKDLYDANFSGIQNEKSGNRRYIETRKILFDPDDYLGMSLRKVVDMDMSDMDTIREYLQEDLIRDGADIRQENIDGNKVAAMIDDAWEKSKRAVDLYKKSSTLIGVLRQKTDNVIRKIAGVLADFVYLCSSGEMNVNDEPHTMYADMRGKLYCLIGDCSAFCADTEGNSLREAAGKRVLMSVLEELKDKMDGTYREQARKYYYIGFLLTGDVTENDMFMPDMSDVAGLPAMSFPARVKCHLEKELKGLEERFADIMNGEDDYGTAKLLKEYASWKLPTLPDIFQKYDIEKIGMASPLESMVQSRHAFIEDLDFAQSNGLFDAVGIERKEMILQVMEAWYEKCRETKNYGFFRRILQAFRDSMGNGSEERARGLRNALAKYCREHPDHGHPEIIKEIETRVETQHYAAAEDLLNRLAANDIGDDSVLEEQNYLEAFLDQEEYETHMSRVSRMGESLAYMLGPRFSKGNRENRGASKFISAWPKAPGMGEEKMADLLGTLGFKVENVLKKSRSSRNMDTYDVMLSKPKNGEKRVCRHPIAAFGSEAEERGFRVVCLFGKRDAVNLIDTFKEIGSAKHTLVFLDYAMPLPERRELARRSKEEHLGKTFLVVDRVMASFIAKNYSETSVNRMLMQLTAPFAYCQPYITSSAYAMPPEIFIGRRQELEKIEDPYGVNIVYGGRQLGKSALLRMAKQDVDFDENRSRAVLVDLKDKDYKASALALSSELIRTGILEKPDKPTDDWAVLCGLIQNRLGDRDKRAIPYLLLLMDEADTFIDSCSNLNYAPFDELKKLQAASSGQMKFVIAGLRDVVRYNRRQALGGNSVMTQLSALTVRPFKELEARELLMKPLSCLGFRFEKNRETEVLISTILGTTNYFPGMIQLYCAKLIETMQRGYGGFNEKDTPPYIIREKQIKKVLSDQGLLEEIRDKFLITLRLGNDDYYYVIALLLARHACESPDGTGCTPQDILSSAKYLQISRISSLTEEKVHALMEELRELNILQNDGDAHYRFSRLNFVRSMGTMEQIDDELLGMMEEEEEQ